MIAVLRQMILSVTAAALFGSVLISLTEGRAQQEIVRIAVGLMVVLALINPLRTVKMPELGGLFSGQEEYRSEGENAYYEAVLEEFTEQTESWLEQRAEELGIECSINISAEQEDGAVSITRAEVSAEGLSEPEKTELIDEIAEQCGISTEAVVIK